MRVLHRVREARSSAAVVIAQGGRPFGACAAFAHESRVPPANATITDCRHSSVVLRLCAWGGLKLILVSVRVSEHRKNQARAGGAGSHVAARTANNDLPNTQSSILEALLLMQINCCAVYCSQSSLCSNADRGHDVKPDQTWSMAQQGHRSCSAPL